MSVGFGGIVSENSHSATTLRVRRDLVASIAVNRVKSIITRLTAAVLSDIYRLPIGDWLIQPMLGGGDASFVSNRFMRM